MPLASTNVPAFRAAYPSYDGRGVIIAVLDGGVDPVPGLARLVDQRDFSGEGRIILVPLRLEDDRILGGGVDLRGAARVRGLTTGTVFGGTLHELTLGGAPAADLNGNGIVGDTLPVIVLRTQDGWAVLADTEGDGSLANDHPVRDFSRGGETFLWSWGEGSPASVSVNLEDRGPDQAPILDLVFDTSAHGTHVAGIAAGHRMFDVAGFDGVAPGAEILSIKIANNAQGGITRTGSMLRGIDYAIRFAAQRRKALVVNISYGVGNEAEGKAAIDALVDSVLAAHPAVVMTISAGNDGPGISTLGFPGSASRPISVGATYPGAFLPLGPGGRRFDDMVAFFSARGGEVARPDLVAPGVAYATVPRWDTGNEVKNGTSMAAPHVAGLAARLLSGLAAEARTVDAAAVKRALVGSSRSLLWATAIDQGAGQPDLLVAWELLRQSPAPRPLVIDGAAAGVVQIAGADGRLDTARTFRLRASRPARYQLRSDVDWLRAPVELDLGDSALVRVTYRPDRLSAPGIYTGVVEGWSEDRAGGAAFRLVNTVIVPRSLMSERLSFRIPEGGLQRVPIRADSGRAFTLRITEPRGAPLLAFLHEPGGMPFRGGAAQVVTDPDSAAVFAVDGRDAVAGVYELVVMAGPLSPVAASVDISPAPARFTARRTADSLRVTLDGGREGASDRDTVGVQLVGTERAILTSSRGSDERRIPFTLPAWARRVVVELRLDRDQWPRFTDFGLTLLDVDGRQLGTSPQNYAVGRLDVPLPAGRRNGQGELLLAPGFAEPGAPDLWSAALSIRLYPDTSGPSVTAPVRSRPAIGALAVLPLPRLPWTLGDGFFPLARVTLRRGDQTWSRESGLPTQLPPIRP
jgi:subtilisin family serine protease